MQSKVQSQKRGMREWGFLAVVVALVIASLFFFGMTSYATKITQGSFHRILLEVGEYLGNETPTITSANWIGLQDGIVYSEHEKTEYRQFLRFHDASETDPIEGGQVVFRKDEHGRVDDFLRFKSGEDMLEYRVSFANGLQSDVEDNKLPDLEDVRLTLLGQDFFIVETHVDTTAHSISLTLFGGILLDTLSEGQEKSYTVDGKEYTVKVATITDEGRQSQVTAIVNGEQMRPLRKGDVALLQDNMPIGIKNVLPNEATEKAGQDQVELYLGAQHITLKDSNYADDTFDEGGATAGLVSLPNARVRIKAFGTSSFFTISTIDYRIEEDAADGDLYLPAGGSLREYMNMPQALLSEKWDLRYNGVLDTGVSEVKFDPEGNNAYKLSFVNRKGRDVRVPFIDASDTFRFGDDDHALVFIEATSSSSPNINVNDYFVLSDGTSDSAETSVLRYESYDSGGKLTFTELGSGVKSMPFDTAARDGTLTVGGSSFSVVVGSNGTLAVDQNNDEVINGGEAVITVQGGGILDFGSTNDISASDSVTVTLRTLRKHLDDASSDEIVSIAFNRTGSALDLDVPDQDAIRLSREDDAEQGRTRYGALFTRERNSGADELEIEYPMVQRMAEVVLVVT